ncbi:MAG: hypothetical protein U0W24_08180 [Bacteroidales bacterium]
MKTNGIFVKILMLLLLLVAGNLLIAQEKPVEKSDIKVMATHELVNLAQKWSLQYIDQNPGVNISINEFDGTFKSSEIKGNEVFLFMHSAGNVKENPELTEIMLGKDLLVPIMNSKNPYLETIKKLNVSEALLSQFAGKSTDHYWSVLSGGQKALKMNLYYTNYPEENKLISSYLSSKNNFSGIAVKTDEQLISAISKDLGSIGFCRLSSLLNSRQPDIYQTITVLPMDRNNNGKVDDFENNYPKFQDFAENVWVMGTPDKLALPIYSIATKSAELDPKTVFLQWITTNGQASLNKSGYFTLVSAEKEVNLSLLNQNNSFVEIKPEESFFARLGGFFGSISLSVYLFVSFIVVLILTFWFMNAYSHKTAFDEKQQEFRTNIDESTIMAPGGLYFDKTHTWAYMEKSGLVKVGIDDFIPHITGTLTRVKMKNPGDAVKKGEAVITLIQNGKKLNIYSPVSGKVISQNTQLIEEPTLINQMPLTEGWVYMIEPSNWLREIKFFTMSEKYREWIKNEFIRLKEILSSSLAEKSPAFAPLVLQDGGEIKDMVLLNLGPETWEDIQTHFIDTMK